MRFKEIVRPLISLIGVIGITAGFFLGKIGADAYLGIVAVAITWWFKSRDDEKAGGGR